MRDRKDIRAFWREHREDRLTLCTLIEKTGSSYRKPGAKKIVASEKASSGLLSGGCLEAEIETAARDLPTEATHIQTFSTLSPEDRFLGYQTGCAGEITILFEPLPKNLDEIDLYVPFGREPKAPGVRIEGPKNAARRSFGTSEPASDLIFFEPWQRPIEVTIVGCGLDVQPVFALINELGWNAHFLDYRASLRDNLPGEAEVDILPVAEIAAAVRCGPRSALLLMSHNYQADLKILAALNDRHSQGETLAYIGCLGPAARFEQLQTELPFPLSADFKQRVKAPAGLFGNTYSPESIALSIIADIEAQFGARSRAP